MKRNLIGEMVIEPSDYTNNIIEELNKQIFCQIEPDLNTGRGFKTSWRETLPESGLYCIYKNEKPIYIGYSAASIRNRIHRFIAGVRGTETNSESHSGAYRYKKYFGEDLSALSIKVFGFDVSVLPDYLNIQDIERDLMYKLRPILNMEINRGYFTTNASIVLE